MPGPRRKRSTRTQKPSFEIVHGGVGETQTGWVYRSDAEPKRTDGEPVQPLWPALRPLDQQRWEPVEPDEPRGEYRLAAPDAPSPAVGMIEAGLMVMTFPVAMTAAMMIAPVLWMLGASRRK